MQRRTFWLQVEFDGELTRMRQSPNQRALRAAPNFSLCARPATEGA
jgi:hypothetical protein